MRAATRWIVLLSMVVLLCAAPPALAKKKTKRCNFRYTAALDELQDHLQSRVDNAPNRKNQRFWSVLLKRVRRCSFRLADDVGMAFFVAHATVPREPDLTLDEILLDAADDLDVLVEAEIDRIASFVQALKNAGNDTKKGEAAVAKGRDLLDDARTQLVTFRRISGLRKALQAAMRAKRAVKVRKPPKKCKGWRLKKGEFCSATVTGRLTHFNIGHARVIRNPAGDAVGMELFFSACNGVDKDLRRVQFDITEPPVAKVYDMGTGRGSYRPGLGFALAMRPGSQLVLTRVSVDGGYVEGTFSFTSAAGSTGNGKFRLTKILEPDE